MKLALEIVVLLVAVALIIIVLSQEGKESGLGAVAGGSDTYWSKNKGRSKEGMKIKGTIVLLVALLAISLLLGSKLFV